MWLGGRDVFVAKRGVSFLSTMTSCVPPPVYRGLGCLFSLMFDVMVVWRFFRTTDKD